MKASRTELIVGLFTLSGLAAVAYLAVEIGGGALIGRDTYPLAARFANVGGLNPGSRVIIAGVPVGHVKKVTLGPDFAAVVEMAVRKEVHLPTDTIASIRTSGLLGDKHVALIPGSDPALLPAGATITETESAVDLESLISRIAFGNVQTTPAAPAKTPPSVVSP